MEINFILGDMLKKLQHMFTLTKGTEREVLTNVLLTVDAQGVNLAATDGRLIQGQVFVGAKVIAPGQVLLPLELLNFLKALKAKSEVVNFKVSGNTLALTLDKTEATFATAEVNQYPSLLAYFDTPHTVDSKDFLVAVKTLQSASGKEPYNLVYACADGKKLTMGTTDNFRISYFELPCDLTMAERALPADVLGALLALGEEKTIHLGFDGRALGFKCSDYQFMLITDIAAMPTNVLRFYDMPDGKLFNVGELIDKARAAGAIAETINLTLQGQLSAQSTRAAYEDTFECTPQTGEFLLNIKHLITALQLPYKGPIMGVKLIGNRKVFHIRDNRMQQCLIPLETK